MTMSQRVARLRQQSLDAKATISTERAELMTEFYRQHLGLVSAPVRRALAFQYLMEHKAICINDGELIVGEKGPAPKAAPTYPELCCHTLEDLDILNSREKIPFVVSPQARQVYEEIIIPFWLGKTMRELIFREMTEEWKAAYEAGVFTEFMEQRSPGHCVLDDKIYNKGFNDFKRDIQRSLDSNDYLNDPDAYDKQEELKAMDICADALIRFAERHAEKALELAQQEADPQRKRELERIAEVCSYVPAHRPRNLWEALQYYWFVHLGVTTELNPWDSFNPGRLDQHLYPFYTPPLSPPVGGMKGGGSEADIEIRRAGLEDIEQAVMLDQALHRHLVTAPIFVIEEHAPPLSPPTLGGMKGGEQWLANSANALWLACRDGEAVACMGLEPSNPTACYIIRDEKTISITSAFTRESQRNKGIATALLNHSLAWARSVGYDRCAVDFEPQNIPAVRFWLRHFQPVCYSLIRHIDERVVSAHGHPKGPRGNPPCES
jgi:GNAT superfamily N-acetyltransferase